MAFAIPGILFPEKTPDQIDHKLLTQTFAVNTSKNLFLTC